MSCRIPYRALVGAALLALPSCVNTLPAPAAPQQQPPRLTAPKTPPKEGYGRVYLDTPEGVANVDLYIGTGHNSGAFPMFVGGMMVMATYTESVDDFRRLCITPCVLDLPSGGHELKFTLRNDAVRTDRTVVVFDQQPAAYLHTVGQDDPNRGPLIGSSIVFALGAANVLVSPIVFAADEDKVGTIMLVGGGAVTALGAFLLYLSRPTKQPGAGTRFVPAEWTASPPPSP